MSNSSHITRHSSLPRGTRGGFALLLTITLLAFLVVLLVGLGAYLRVETAVAGNTQRQTQARQNALMALDVALGQLQKYAGPDQTVTATADGFGGTTGTRHFTGVWSSNTTATDTPATPLTWLVSGNEFQNAPLSVTPTTRFSTTDSVELVGAHTSGTARDVIAKLQPVTTVGAPGVAGATAATIGRYAWWVGDQGVKAPVTLADPTAVAASFNYAPYTSAELLSRIRQQVSLGAGPADTAAAAVFEPRDTNNTPLDTNYKITAYNQIAFLKNSSNAVLGLTPLKTYFHIWSPNNFAVLANTASSPTNLGLRQDLSLFSPANPSPLGTSYDAWANYDPANTGYMEDFTNPASPVPLPAYSSDPMRRRYVMQAPAVNAGAVQSVAPILSYFLLTFNVRTQGGSQTVQPLEARARWGLTLWNPYTSALYPENLRIEVTGLPDVQVIDTTTPAAVLAPVSLQTIYGSSGSPSSPMMISLPWDSSTNVAPDTQSWLPGRVYSWTSLDSAASPATAAGFGSMFYSQNIDGTGGQGVIMPSAAGSIDGNDICQLSAAGTTLVVKLYAVRAGGDVLLGTFNSPAFSAFTTTAAQIFTSGYQFSFVFRLAESDNGTGAWLTTGGYDVRATNLPSAAFVGGANGPAPEQYVNYVTFSAPDRLLDRATNSLTYDEDVPVFELPRSPLLSLGSLQHLQIDGSRPFAIGNSWGEAVQLSGPTTNFTGDSLFDQFFYSGLAPNVTPAVVNGALVLPNPLLKPLPRNSATGAAVALTDLQGVANQQSSKFLLQGGAFNVNSINPTAWAAVLRSVRFPAPAAFNYLDADLTTGSGPDSPPASPPIQSSDAQFFRFAHSAQETYKAESGQGAGGTVASAANTDLFRKGMITLTPSQVTALASKISTAVSARQSVSGPFHTLEEFLSPVAAGSPSLLEQAISDAGINGSTAEFSSQWLTQADIMTALAPVLFPRSDTFIIRTYGEAVNPTTAATEGRAWCEAVVQRVPDYFDPSTATGDAAEIAPTALVSTLNQTFGRRFKVISFRWLTRSDI